MSRDPKTTADGILPGLPGGARFNGKSVSLPPLPQRRGGPRTWNTAGGVVTPVVEIQGQLVDLSRTAIANYRKTDPKSRWEALKTALISSTMRGERCGAPSGETLMLKDLALLLDEATAGCFANPMWPKPTKKRATSFDRARAKAGIQHLVILQERMSGCDRPEACSRVANDLDQWLKEHQTSLENELNSYRTEAAGDPDSDRRQRPHSPATADRPRRHEMSSRIKRWFEEDETEVFRLQKAHIAELEQAGHSVQAIYAQVRYFTGERIVCSSKRGPDSNPQDPKSDA